MTAVFSFWIANLSLMSGVAAESVLLFGASASKRSLAKSFALFLGSLWLIDFSFMLRLFAAAVSAAGVEVVLLLADGVGIAGSISYILVAPNFYHDLLGLPKTGGYRRMYRIVYAATLALSAIYAAGWVRAISTVLLNSILFGLVLYGILLILLQYRRIVERSLRRAALFFCLLAFLFFPLMYFEARPEHFLPKMSVGAFQYLGLPLFFGLLSVASIPFTLRYVLRPAMLESSGVSSFFLEEYGISPRETEVINLLLGGTTTKEIGEQFFISAKTVENHLTSIYRKTGVSGRGQLITLLYANHSTL